MSDPEEFRIRIGRPFGLTTRLRRDLALRTHMDPIVSAQGPIWPATGHRQPG